MAATARNAKPWNHGPSCGSTPFSGRWCQFLEICTGNPVGSAVGIAEHRREPGDGEVVLLREHEPGHRRAVGIVSQRDAPAVQAVEMFLRVVGAFRVAPRLLRQRKRVAAQCLIVIRPSAPESASTAGRGAALSPNTSSWTEVLQSALAEARRLPRRNSTVPSDGESLGSISRRNDSRSGHAEISRRAAQANSFPLPSANFNPSITTRWKNLPLSTKRTG